MSIENDIEYLERLYHPEHDLFDDEIQMNHVDKRLLELIIKLHDQIDSIETWIIGCIEKSL